MSIISSLILKLLDSLGCHAVERTFDSLFEHRDNKRRKAQIDDIQSGVHETNTLLSVLSNDSSSTIRDAVDELKPLIKTLHVVSAHDVLDKLRTKIKATDRQTLARIDYYRGCCSRYINRNQCVDEYELAWKEMVDCGIYDPEIVGGKIFVHCLKKERNEAVKAADRLKQISRDSIWAWIPSLLFSDSLKKAYEAIPNDVDSHAVLYNSCLIDTNVEFHAGFLSDFSITLPSAITYDNIPEWVFDLSVLLNRYIQEWNMTIIVSGSPGKACIEFNHAVAEFEGLCSKTQLEDFVSDIRLWYLISQYQICRDKKVLEDIKICKCRKDFEIHRDLSYAICLAKDNRPQEAKKYLTGLGLNNDISILNIRMFLALQTADSEYAELAIKDATDNAVEFDIGRIIYLLAVARSFPASLSPYADKIRLPDGLDSDAVRILISYFIGKETDVDFLLRNADNFSHPVIPHVSLVLSECGHVEEAISLCERGLSPYVVDLRTYIYITILQKSPAHTDKLYKFLGDLRKDGFTDDANLLVREYSLASRVHDTYTMLEVSRILYEKNPKWTSYFVSYITSAAIDQKYDVVKELSNNLNDYQYDAKDAGRIFNVLLVSGFYNQSIEFLYSYIISHPTDENLNLMFMNASINPSTSKIINEEYDTVFDGAYVRYRRNGELKSDTVTGSTRLSKLIGKRKRDTIEDIDQVGRKYEYEIVEVFNKYRRLLDSINKDIEDGKYVNTIACHYSDDDLKDGRIFDIMGKMTGRDEGWFRLYNEELGRFRQGKRSISEFLQENNLIPSLYEHLFGTFKVYGLPYQVYGKLHGLRNDNLSEFAFVLDLTSLILFFELQRKFGLVIARKFVISTGLLQYVKSALLKEKHGTPSSIHVSKELLKNDTDTFCLEERLNELIAWIYENVNVEQATEVLNIDINSFADHSDYFKLLSEALLLTQRGGRVFMSVDLCVLLNFMKSVPITDVNSYCENLFPDRYSEIEKFFIKSSILSGNITTEYVLEEYDKHAVGKSSLFDNCKECITLSPVTSVQVLDVCVSISERPIKTEGDNLVIDDLLRKIFEKLDYQSSGMVLKLLHQRSTNSDLLARAQAAFKLAHPLY